MVIQSGMVLASTLAVTLARPLVIEWGAMWASPLEDSLGLEMALVLGPLMEFSWAAAKLSSDFATVLVKALVLDSLWGLVRAQT
jgi:hypothetical protein